ncbi:MAG: CPBP family intramembrane metalloprotease [Caldilineaceae bacterium]|nr:CPBP family intramembrane metalloprotease [Caldilineaceae bacterium]
MNMRHNNDSLVRLPALQLLGLLWLASALYCLSQGHALVLGLVTVASVVWGLHTWVSVRITDSPPPDPSPSVGTRGRLWLQTGIIVILAAIANQPLPLWRDLVDGLRSWGEQMLPVAWVGGPGNAVANPVQYFMIPFLLLLLLGAKPSALGLQRGHQSGRVCLVWLLLLLVIWVALLTMGQLPVQTLARRLIGNALQNGFFEEFLFRGALQSRLTRLIAPNWALAVQAILFGLWHVNANLNLFAGDGWSALAWCMVAQAPLGLLLGILFQRTRSLLAPSVAHVIMNALGQTFG